MPSSRKAQELETLYVEHQGWLKAWLRRRAGSPEQAADLTQDTFLRVLLKPALEVIEEPRAYLTVIAKGLLANLFRRRDLERAYLDVLAQSPPALAPSPEEGALLLEALNEIDALLERLPPLVKRAFLLSQIDGLTYPEIAGRLGISERTVKRNMVLAFSACLTVELA